MKMQQKSIDLNRNVLFEVASNGRKTVESLVKEKLFRWLFLISQKHINEQKRQLVVFSFDFIAHHINLDGIFEKGELDTFFAWMSEQPEVFDGIAIDVGANIGNHSLYFSDFYRKVYSFEPNPRTYQVLKLNAELVTNVTCFDCGISDVDRPANLNIYANNIGHSDLPTTPLVDAGATSVGIQLKTLDAIIDPEEKVRLIKYDVEGHEYQAIHGSMATIEKNKPIILFEQLSTEIKNGTSNVIDLLKTCGYSQFASVKQSTTRLRSPNRWINVIFMILNKILIAKSFLLGTTWTVQIQQSFEQTDYPFIVAIPDWLNIKAG